MGKVVADMSMSLDGFVADPSDGVDKVFGWYGTGDVAVASAHPDITFQVSENSAAYLREAIADTGALVSGRRTFDLAQGWDGKHPTGVPVFIVTHSVPDGWPRADVPFTFVTDGIESAIAQAKATAGDKSVCVASPSIAQQCLEAGLLDEIQVAVVPVLLGDGIRLFERFKDLEVDLTGPRVIEGKGVTHLVYGVESA
ncbi:dihydrofolate reductase family protein [Amycolatopsis sp. TRM77291]